MKDKQTDNWTKKQRKRESKTKFRKIKQIEGLCITGINKIHLNKKKEHNSKKRQTDKKLTNNHEIGINK